MDSAKPTLRFQTTPKTGLSAAKFQGGHGGHHPIATKTPTRFCCDESEAFQDLTISTVSSGRLARTESGSQPTQKSTFGLFFQLLLLFEVTTCVNKLGKELIHLCDTSCAPFSLESSWPRAAAFCRISFESKHCLIADDNSSTLHDCIDFKPTPTPFLFTRFECRY